MMPLCTTAMLPLQSACGCALTSFGSPCVAQRVCAMPTLPLSRRGTRRLDLPHLPRRLVHAQPAARDQRHPGRVVAAILQPVQPGEQDRQRVLPPDVAYDSTHRSLRKKIRDR